MNSMSGIASRPWVVPLVAFVGGLLIGWLLLSFLFPTVTLTNADQWDLNPNAKVQWIAMAADSYSLNGDKNLARERLRGFKNEEINAVLSELIASRNTGGRPLEAQRLQNFATQMGYAISPAAGGIPGATRPAGTSGSTGSGATAPSGSGNSLNSALPLIGLLALLVIAGVIGMTLLRNRPAGAGAPAVGQSARAAVARMMPQAQPRQPAREGAAARMAAAPLASGATAASTRPLFGTFAATYKFGQDQYESPFELETPRGDWLGETGMGVSDTIGEGKPDKVTAFDLYLFDKGDARTETKILMSEYAYNDPTLRAKLASKGELVLAEKGKRVLFDTANLTVEATIADLVYASTPGLPPSSHFQKLIVEMVPAQK